MSKRERIDIGADKRYARRNDDGTFKESADVSRSLSADDDPNDHCAKN